MKNIVLIIFLVPALLRAATEAAWVTVEDGREHAFSIEVPKGWKATGGMFRFMGVNPRPYINMESPDGKINLRVGDPTIPNYTSPGPMHRPGPGVAAYASGDVFATKYGQARFGNMCQNVQVKQAGPTTPRYNQPAQGPVHVTAGAAAFTCTSKGQQMLGYVYAETMLVGGQLESNWYVVSLASFLAPAAQAEPAGAMLKHSGESIAMNPAWMKAEGQRIKEATALLLSIAHQTWVNTQEMNARQAKFNAMMRQESAYAQDVISGVTYTRDPNTGQAREVYTGSGANKWTNQQGTVIDSTLSPGQDFHQLQVLPRP